MSREANAQDLFRAAVASERQVEELSSVARRLIAEGYTRPELVRQLEEFRKELLAAGRDQEDDAVLDVMDFLTGWCSSHMRI